MLNVSRFQWLYLADRDTTLPQDRSLKTSFAAEGKRWDDALDLLRQAQIRYFRF